MATSTARRTWGGANGFGTIFKITPNGALTTLHTFDDTNGANPRSLVQGTEGTFYGTTQLGGANTEGTIFEITLSGRLTTLHSFGFEDPNGTQPIGALVQGTDGNFYGTTVLGGVGGCGQGCGTAFKITPGGTLTTLHSFDLTDGYEPYGGVVQGTDGTFYGTTYYGGANGKGVVFTMTPSGTVTRLYSFCSQSDCTDGALPQAGLVLGTDGNFYGTTTEGGTAKGICSEGCGTIFEITSSGTLTTLYNFCSELNGKVCKDGARPVAGMIQDTDGAFYGPAGGGGAKNDGTIYSLSVGLKPFVKTQPTAGAVGAAVNILGSNLTDATGVTFNGTPAVFTVASNTLITTTVPTGATAGTVEVVTPNGKGLSNVPFTVLP